MEAGKADGTGWLVQEEWNWVWLDLDKCLDGETGAIDAWAQAIIGRAGGAYLEVTPSGTGLRLCGRAGLDVPMQGVWRVEGALAEGARPGAQVEIFYACARYVTVTGHTLGGSLDVDLGALAMELWQRGQAQAPAGRNSKGGSVGGGGIAGDKTAPIEDVAAALEAMTNDSVDWNEWSRIGMAAWGATRGSWEGLEAWMGWSAKCEDKHDPGACLERWEHWGRSPPSDLGIGTLVTEAQAASGGRWRRPSRQPAAEFQAEEGDDEDGGAGEEPEPEGKRDTPFVRLAKRVVYVLNVNRFYDEVTGELLNREQLAAVASRLGVAGFGAQGKKSAAAMLMDHPKRLLRFADRLTMRPGGDLLGVEDGRPVLNLWRRSDLVPSEADASVWLEHMQRLIPAEAERELVLDLLAFGLQHPGVKINWALVLLGGQGTGKDTALKPFFAAIGHRNVATVPGVAIGGQFNSYLRSPWLLITEMPPANKRSCYEEIKSWLTTPPNEIPINEKNVPMYQVPNVVNAVVTTNHAGAIALAEDDRRFAVVETARAGPEDADESRFYYGRLHGWLDAGGDAAVAGWLLRRDVTAFDPKAAPPMTDAKAGMVREGAPPGVAWACGLWEEGGGGLFERRELLTVVEVMQCATHAGHGAGEPVRRSLIDKHVLMAMRLTGWRQIQTRVNDGATRPMPWTRSRKFELLSQLAPKLLQARLEEDRRLRTGGEGVEWER